MVVEDEPRGSSGPGVSACVPRISTTDARFDTGLKSMTSMILHPLTAASFCAARPVRPWVSEQAAIAMPSHRRRVPVSSVGTVVSLWAHLEPSPCGRNPKKVEPIGAFACTFLA